MEILDWKEFIKKFDIWLYEADTREATFLVNCADKIVSSRRRVNKSQFAQYIKLKKAIEVFSYHSTFKEGYVELKLSRNKVLNQNLSIAINYLVTSEQEFEKIKSYPGSNRFQIWSDNQSLLGKGINLLPSNLSFSQKKNYIIENSKKDYLIILHSRIQLNDYKVSNTRYPITVIKIKYEKNNKRYLDYEFVSNFMPWISLKKYGRKGDVAILKLDGSVIIGRRDVLRKFQLNPNLDWGEGEDVWWSSLLALNNVAYKFEDKYLKSSTSKWSTTAFLIPNKLKSIVWKLKNLV